MHGGTWSTGTLFKSASKQPNSVGNLQLAVGSPVGSLQLAAFSRQVGNKMMLHATYIFLDV